MILNVDKEAKSMIVQLCDIALKQAGVKNINQVNKILGAVNVIFRETIPEAEVEKKCLDESESTEEDKKSKG